MAEIALIGAAVGGGALSAVSSIAGGQSARKAGNQAAFLADEDAKIAESQAKFKARQERLTGEELIGRGIAITGASGTKVGRGSNLRVREVNQGRLETSVSNILFSGRVAANKLRNQGNQFRAQGKAAQTAGFVNAGTSILSTITQVGGISNTFSIMDKLKTADVANQVATAVIPPIS